MIMRCDAVENYPSPSISEGCLIQLYSVHIDAIICCNGLIVIFEELYVFIYSLQVKGGIS